MKINLTFDQAWSNIYELCYDSYGMTGNQYLLGMELACCNLTTTISKDDPYMRVFDEWETKSMYAPQTNDEKAEFLQAYTELIKYIIEENTLRFNNHEGECIMLPNCAIIYTHGVYLFDVYDEDWHMIRDINDANPILFEMWKEFCEQENQ